MCVYDRERGRRGRKKTEVARVNGNKREYRLQIQSHSLNIQYNGKWCLMNYLLHLFDSDDRFYQMKCKHKRLVIAICCVNEIKSNTFRTILREVNDTVSIHAENRTQRTLNNQSQKKSRPLFALIYPLQACFFPSKFAKCTTFCGIYEKSDTT